jgi:hypothetical protein
LLTPVQAFENDRESTTGGSRKTTSVWVLTDEAIRNGVQSTTRYRKNGTAKTTSRGRKPAISRQQAGARGGRAARNAARRRNYVFLAVNEPPLTTSPSTVSFSDYSDYAGFEYYDAGFAARSWPVTPADDDFGAQESRLFKTHSH